MANTNIRDLRVFEFNRALSYVSEILEIKRNCEKLGKEQLKLQIELDQWYNELALNSSSYTEDEICNIKTFQDSINARIAEIDEEQEDLKEYEKELEKLVKKVLEFVIGDENLDLTKEEIQESFVEEYIYILTEIKLGNDETYIAIPELFEHKSDLILLLYDVYGREQEELISDIGDVDLDDEFENSFYNYFPFE